MPLVTLGSATPQYQFINTSSGTISVQTTVGFVLATLAPNTSATVTGTTVSGGGATTDWIVSFDLTPGGNITAANYTGTTVSVTGNITAGAFVGAGTGLTSIPGGNVTGTVSAASSATTAGTVTTAAQPNITSVGTLTGVTVSGAANLGAVGNITITGGTNGFVLSTNGSGSLSWVAQSGGGAESPNVITISSANSSFATSNGVISTNRIMGLFNSANRSGTYNSPNWFWNYTGQNSACTAPALNDSIELGRLRLLGGVSNINNITMAVQSNWGSDKPGIGFIAGTQLDILNSVVNNPVSNSSITTTTMVAVGFPKNGPRLLIQAANIVGSNGEVPANVISYIATQHELDGNTIVNGTLSVMGNVDMQGNVAYLPWNTSDPVALYDGAIYYNNSTSKIRVRLGGVWANITTS
jgi:hypothetical protein